MASVYILYSEKLSKFYIGSCFDLERRLSEHKTKHFQNSFTTLATDWILYFAINDLEEDCARNIEKHIKSMKSKKYIENLKKYSELQQKLIAHCLSK